MMLVDEIFQATGVALAERFVFGACGKAAGTVFITYPLRSHGVPKLGYQSKGMLSAAVFLEAQGEKKKAGVHTRIHKCIHA